MEESSISTTQMPDTGLVKDYLYRTRTTQKALALKMGCSAADINGYLNHAKLGMRTDTLVRMVTALGGTVEVRLPGKTYTLLSREQTYKEAHPNPDKNPDEVAGLEEFLQPGNFAEIAAEVPAGTERTETDEKIS